MKYKSFEEFWNSLTPAVRVMFATFWIREANADLLTHIDMQVKVLEFIESVGETYFMLNDEVSDISFLDAFRRYMRTKFENRSVYADHGDQERILCFVGMAAEDLD